MTTGSIHPIVRILLVILTFVSLSGCGAGENKATTSSAEIPLRKTKSDRVRASSAEEELAGFKLPPGFSIELVASEEAGIIKPIDLTFDDAGRLWTQTAKMYPLDPIADIKWKDLRTLMEDQKAQATDSNFVRVRDLYQGKTKGIDRILVLSGLYEKGKLKVSTWADGLAIPQSIWPVKSGAYVAQGSEVFFLDDTDGDGVADKRTPLLSGFGFTDTHTMSHSLIRGPGNWFHFSHGALNKGEAYSLQSMAKVEINYSKIARFSLDARKLELVNSGLNNIWGFQLRGNGQWYGSEANDWGFSITPMEPGTGFPGIGNDRLRYYQPWMPELHAFRVGGTGISGAAFNDDASGSFPDEWKNVAFLANPITSTINAVRVERHPDGSVSSEHLPDFLTSEDDWFRPVNLEFGPDGCLYVADWYNKIISHNELPTSHPDRDKSHGRIWRICPSNQSQRDIPDFYKIKTADLVRHLQSPSLWEKRAAWHQIADRDSSETKRLASDLVALLSDQTQDESTRIHSLWSLESIGHYDAALFSSLLKTPLHNLRREAVRSLASFPLNAQQIYKALKDFVADPNPAVRSQVIRTVAESASADHSTIDLLVRFCNPEIPGNAMGGPYERKFERFLARKALEQYPVEFKSYLNSSLVNNVPVGNLLWAVQALPAPEGEKAFINLWPRSNVTQLDESTFVSLAKMLKCKTIYDITKPLIQDPAYAGANVKFALDNQPEVQSKELSGLLETPVIKLLRSDVQSDITLALDAISSYKIANTTQEIDNIIDEDTPFIVLESAMLALGNDVKRSEATFVRIFDNEKFSFNIRLTAFQYLVRAGRTSSLQQAAGNWVPTIKRQEKQEFVTRLSGSKEGVKLLSKLYKDSVIDISAFDISSAERIFNSSPGSPQAQAILEGVRSREVAEQAAFKDRLAKYMAIAQRGGGNPQKGEVLFQTCLTCHRVGNKGQEIAPSLDGSANREYEALLTSILEPDAAVENSYRVFRVTKKDGTVVEGYVIRRDAQQGTTLAVMGGRRVFIKPEDIKNQGYLSGRSFMVRGLIDDYSDDEVADLLAYIRTLH
jgi:putative heme-binding domain-containing protein